MIKNVYTVGYKFRSFDEPTSCTFVSRVEAEAFARVMECCSLVERVREPVPRKVHASGAAIAKQILKDARGWEEVCSDEVVNYREDD